jgi:hypothetical protein
MKVAGRALTGTRFNSPIRSGDEAAFFVFGGERGGRRTVRLQGLMHDREYVVDRRPDGPTQVIPGSEMLADGISVELGPSEGGLWRIAWAR